MRRRKDIVGSPVRDSSEIWQVIEDLLRDSLAQAAGIDPSAIARTLTVAKPVVRMLIAAGQLDKYPVTLVAGATVCDIFTVSGAAALTFEENLNPIVGVSSTDIYTVHLPTGRFESVVVAAAEDDPNISAQPALDVQTVISKSAAGPLVDLSALQRALEQR